jgi:hypothetical protein
VEKEEKLGKEYGILKEKTESLELKLQEKESEISQKDTRSHVFRSSWRIGEILGSSIWKKTMDAKVVI